MKQALAAPFKRGVNFTVWLEYRPTDQINEDFFTKKDFENVKKLGCDVVRLPIHFENFCKAEDGYVIPDKILRILDKVVGWVEELGLYVIFDFHNSTTVDSQTTAGVEDILIPVWTQLAERYKDASELVIFELMNEPHGIDIPVWNGIIARVFDKVRSIDSKHYIVVGGADWNSFNGMKQLPEFKDDKVIYTFHFYDPHTFTHQGAGWCHMERVVGIPFPYDADKMPALPENPTEREIKCFENYPEQGTIEAVEKFFEQYAEFSIERNAPVYCGEFGCFAPTTKPEERANWYRIVTERLSERNISRTSWDYYGTFGIYDMTKHSWQEVREKGMGVWQFPDDLNMDIVRAMGLNDQLN